MPNTTKTCTRLPKRKVEEAIGKLKDAGMKRKARAWLAKQMTPRHGSETYARKHPRRAVTDDQKVQMARMHKAGLSFRALEEVFKLKPNSGNDAQRCVKAGLKIIRRRRRTAVAV